MGRGKAKEGRLFSIMHEVYQIPARKWESIFVNYHPTGLGATTYKIDVDGQRKWTSPLVDASRGLLRSSKGRMSLSEGNDHDIYGDDPFSVLFHFFYIVIQHYCKHEDSLFIGSAIIGATSAYKATTTHYYDGQEGACGCGSSSGAFPWQLGIGNGVYTAAGSQAFLIRPVRHGGVAGQSIIVMVTNLCPNNGNAVWCPNVGGTNQYGYSYHFDIMAENQVFGDNVVVDFEPIACPGQAVADWGTCLCNGIQETDTTPVLGSDTSPPPPGSSSSKPVASSSKPATSSAKPATSSAKPAASSTPPSNGGQKQTLYGQCGGIGWAGPTVCQTPATCKTQNPWYSQCLN
ncbi:Endoglucanase-5 [Trichoderma virens FT-333]|nr:Endoglucanase-5 [Trichoderma virens FT-333]